MCWICVQTDWSNFRSHPHVSKRKHKCQQQLSCGKRSMFKTGEPRGVEGRFSKNTDDGDTQIPIIWRVRQSTGHPPFGAVNTLETKPADINSASFNCWQSFRSRIGVIVLLFSNGLKAERGNRDNAAGQCSISRESS